MEEVGKWDGEGRQRRRCPAESERGAQVEGHPQGAAAAPKGFVVRQTLAGDEQEEVTVVPRLPSAVGGRQAGSRRRTYRGTPGGARRRCSTKRLGACSTGHRARHSPANRPSRLPSPGKTALPSTGRNCVSRCTSKRQQPRSPGHPPVPHPPTVDVNAGVACCMLHGDVIYWPVLAGGATAPVKSSSLCCIRYVASHSTGLGGRSFDMSASPSSSSGTTVLSCGRTSSEQGP